ncbi:MAG: hypothetical protein PHN39_00295 [Candidatus Pacebacteria bacterium]|nr:hypothetical protein [Candidatus Paceibacterota bacterium]
MGLIQQTASLFCWVLRDMAKKQIDVKNVQEQMKVLQAKAEKEIEKVKKDLEKAKNQVEGFVKKNPEKAALISAGIGVALGAVMTALMKGGKKK